MADLSDPTLKEEVWDVRDDSTPSNWIALGYASKTKIKVVAKGDTGYEGLLEMCTPDAVLFCLLRLIQGDRESRRVKFVGITFVGEDVGGMQRGRVGAHSGPVKQLFGQMNIEISADNKSEMDYDLIIKKIKVAGGADYDTGSNANGYKTRGGSIRKSGLAAYQAKEKQGNISGVLYNTSALSRTTPVDLGGRPTVASASEAKKNTKDNTNDVSKHLGKASVVKNAPKSGLSFNAAKPGSKPNAKPAPAPSKPKITAAKPKTPEPAPEPKVVEEPVASAVTEELSDDPEVRARQRAERRKARQKAMAEKAREEVASLRAAMSTGTGSDEPSVENVQEPQQEEVSAPVEEEQVAEPEEQEQEQEQVAAPVEKKAPAKSKASSLFDDDEDDDDDLFSKPKKSDTPAEEEEELPADPQPVVDDRVVEVPYVALKAFLVKFEMLVADFDGSPEELAQMVIDNSE